MFFSANFALLAGFFGIGATIRIGQEMLCLQYAGFFLVFANGFVLGSADLLVAGVDHGALVLGPLLALGHQGGGDATLKQPWHLTVGPLRVQPHKGAGVHRVELVQDEADIFSFFLPDLHGTCRRSSLKSSPLDTWPSTL